MLGCCGGRGRASNPTQERRDFQLDPRVCERLDRLVELYPGVPTVAVLSYSGEVIARREGKPSSEGEGPVELSADVLAAIASLKKVALHMGPIAVTLREADCSVITITGDTHMFSCYELGAYLLAVFLDVRGLDADQVDLSSVEIQVAEITQQLRALIRVYDHPTA